jgi:hypothetical protein
MIWYLMSLTIHPHPENIARIQSLIDKYETRIQTAKMLKIVDQSGTGLGILPLLYRPEWQDPRRRQELMRELSQRRCMQRTFQMDIFAFRDRKTRLETVLDLVDRPEQFRAKMSEVKEYLLGVPDDFDPFDERPVWYPYDLRNRLLRWEVGRSCD